MVLKCHVDAIGLVVHELGYCGVVLRLLSGQGTCSWTLLGTADHQYSQVILMVDWGTVTPLSHRCMQ